jgi:hypothetical protein
VDSPYSARFHPSTKYKPGKTHFTRDTVKKYAKSVGLFPHQTGNGTPGCIS